MLGCFCLFTNTTISTSLALALLASGLVVILVVANSDRLVVFSSLSSLQCLIFRFVAAMMTSFATFFLRLPLSLLTLFFFAGSGGRSTGRL